MPNRDRKQAYAEYWTALKQSSLEDSTNEELKEMFVKFKPSNKYYHDLPLENGGKGEHIVLRLFPDKNSCSAGLYFGSYEASKCSIEKFERKKDEIENAYSIKLSMGRTIKNGKPGKAYEIRTTGGLKNLYNKDCWSQAIDWMKQYCLILKEIYFQATHESAISIPYKTIEHDSEKASMPDECTNEDLYPETVDTKDAYYEGAVETVTVNRYERNSEAREKCIKLKGTTCSVCGLDFKELYGEIGNGFIHVHHLLPLNKIGKEYKVDYEKDLIPVCPNCHAMLHRKLNGHTLTVEELKKIVEKRNSTK